MDNKMENEKRVFASYVQKALNNTYYAFDCDEEFFKEEFLTNAIDWWDQAVVYARSNLGFDPNGLADVAKYLRRIRLNGVNNEADLLARTTEYLRCYYALIEC